MKIIPLRNKQTRKKFYNVARDIYKDDPNWVCPLDIEIEANFDEDNNNFFKRGEADRWIAVDDKGKALGRIAAFVDYERAKQYNQPTGGIGFFESYNDTKVAYSLFDTAKEWLKARGMEAMDGPINFGENDSYWGLLVDGFTQPGYGMPYHHPYYKDLFEGYGFRLYYEQYSYHLDVTKPFPERFWKIANRVLQKPGFHFAHFEKKNKEKFFKDLTQIYNETWSSFKEDFTPMEDTYFEILYNKLKPVLDPELVWLAYYKEKPIAFMVMLPDINQILKHLNGKLHFINKLRFRYMLKRNKINRTRAMVMGVNPKFQKSGIESAIFRKLKPVFERKTQYKEIELSWVGDFNPKMHKLYEEVGGVLAKKHRTYRHLFDPNATFERYPIPETAIKIDAKNKYIDRPELVNEEIHNKSR